MLLFHFDKMFVRPDEMPLWAGFGSRAAVSFVEPPLIYSCLFNFLYKARHKHPILPFSFL